MLNKGIICLGGNDFNFGANVMFDCHVYLAPIGGGRGIVMPMSVCLFVCLCVCLFVCVFVCLSVFSQNFKV